MNENQASWYKRLCCSLMFSYYIRFLPMATIFVIFYMAVMPMFVIYVSFKCATSKADDDEYIEFYGVITSRFKWVVLHTMFDLFHFFQHNWIISLNTLRRKSHIWWEAFISIRRVVICALLVHLSDDPHKCISVVSTLILLSIAIQLHQKPFLSVIINNIFLMIVLKKKINLINIEQSTVAFLENFLLFCNYCLVQVALVINHHDESSKESTTKIGFFIYYTAIGISGN